MSNIVNGIAICLLELLQVGSMNDPQQEAYVNQRMHELQNHISATIEAEVRGTPYPVASVRHDRVRRAPKKVTLKELERIRQREIQRQASQKREFNRDQEQHRHSFAEQQLSEQYDFHESLENQEVDL